MSREQTDKLDKLVEVLGAIGVSVNEDDRNGESANAVDGLFALARAVESCATWLKWLGTNDAADSRGALEVLSCAIGNVNDPDESLAKSVERGLDGIAESVDRGLFGIAQAVREGLESVAEALARGRP